MNELADHKPPLEAEQSQSAPQPQALESAAQPPAQEATAPTKKPKKIAAEKYFDTGLYGTVSYFGQALASVLLTQWIKHGSGKQKFNATSHWLGKNILETHCGSTPENAAKQANTLLVATTLIMVGNCFLAPVKYIEDHKPEFVRKINDWLNERREQRCGVISETERKEQDTAIAYIAEQPRQTWGSLLSARVFSLGAIYAAISAVGGKNNKTMEDTSANVISKTLHSIGVAKQNAYSKPVQNFGRIAFVDFAYSLVGAGALYLYSHSIAPPKHKKKPGVATAPEASDGPPSANASTRTEEKTIQAEATTAEAKEESWKSHLREPKQSFVDLAARTDTPAMAERL